MQFTYPQVGDWNVLMARVVRNCLILIAAAAVADRGAKSLMADDSSPSAQTKTQAVAWQWGPLLPRAQSAFGTTATSAGVVVVGGTNWSAEGNAAKTKHWLTTV